MKDQKLYNLIWYVYGIKKETILIGKPIALCKWKENILKVTTHKIGKFKIEPYI